MHRPATMRRLGSGALLTLRHSQGTVVLECSAWYTAELCAKGHEWRLCQVRIVDASKVDRLRLPEAPRTSSFLHTRCPKSCGLCGDAPRVTCSSADECSLGLSVKAEPSLKRGDFGKQRTPPKQDTSHQKAIENARRRGDRPLGDGSLENATAAGSGIERLRTKARLQHSAEL